MKTQDEINKAAEEAITQQVYNGLNDSISDYRQVWINGATFANGYSEEEMCGFAEWVQTSLIYYSKHYNAWTRLGYNDRMTTKDLLKLYNERK